MDNTNFYKAVAESYNDNLKCSLNGLKDMVIGAFPIFGELIVNIEDIKDGKKMTFIDKDKANMVVGGNISSLTEDDLDMSAIALKITLDKNNKVTIVEHGVSFITPANKNLMLFLGSLVGKKIEL